MSVERLDNVMPGLRLFLKAYVRVKHGTSLDEYINEPDMLHELLVEIFGEKTANIIADCTRSMQSW